jgi:predicted nuclease of restriction endonuclease-like (RecB) superfamily
MNKNVTNTKPRPLLPKGLLRDVVAIIRRARQSVARNINSAQVILYWDIGRRTRKDILKCKRARYGDAIVSTLSTQLEREFDMDFSPRTLFRMMQFVKAFPDREIVSTLSTQLGWSHFIELLPLKDDLQRQFYAEMCRMENWNVHMLRTKIGSMLYERTALSKKPVKLIRRELDALRDENKLTPDLVFRDPYFLHFLGLKDNYAEKDLEAAILREMENFILELGIGFSFIARQKRITVDGEDYHLDLLFFNRRLHRLVAIDLKMGKFAASDKGQMELYLRWLEKNEMQQDEQPPAGLILCAGKSEEHVELLQLEKSGIRVAAYLTTLPPREVLEKKLHESIARNRALLEYRKNHEYD